MERGCGEASTRAIERGDRDAAKDIAIAATVADQLALTQHHDDAFEIGVATHGQRARHNQKSRAARERAISLDKRELATGSRVGDRLRTSEVTVKRLCFVLQTAEIGARLIGRVRNEGVSTVP